MIDVSVDIINIHTPLIRLNIKTDHHNSMKYDVYRDGSIIGSVSTQEGIRNAFFEDTGITLGAKDKIYTYKIKCFFTDGRFKEESDEVTTDSKYRVFEKHIMKMQDVYLRTQAGMPYLFYERKVLALEHCPICWDEALNRAVTDINGCSLCLGTGIIDPYYPPVIVYVSDTRPDNKTQSADELGRMTGWDESSLIANGLPILKNGDLLLDPIEHSFFELDSVTSIGRKHAPIMQIVKIKKTPQSKEEYVFIDRDLHKHDDLINAIRQTDSQRRW